MIFSAVEQIATVIAAHFAADYAALAETYGVAALPTAATVVQDQEAEVFVPFGVSLPAIGVLVLDFTTQAKSQGVRDTGMRCKLDWFIRGTDPSVIGQQTRVAVEALQQSIDRLAGSGGTIIGGGEEPGSSRGQIASGYQETISPNYESRAQLTFELTTQDSGL